MRKRVSMLAGVIVCLACFAHCQATPLEKSNKYRGEGISAQQGGQLEEAERLFLLAFKEAEKAEEEDILSQLNLLHSLELLALLYRSQGKNAQADQLFSPALEFEKKRTLGIEKKLMTWRQGSDEVFLFNYLQGLARLYQALGRDAEAERVYGRALEFIEKEAPDLLVDTLALWTESSGEAKLAGEKALREAIFKRTVSFREKSFAPDSHQVSESLNNLAEFYSAHGKYAEAEPLRRRLLAIQEKKSGANHPDVAEGLNDLAQLYSLQGKFAQAEVLFMRALAIWGITAEGVDIERILQLGFSFGFHGPSKPDIFPIIGNYAGLLRKMKRDEEAARVEGLLKKILAEGQGRVPRTLPP